MRMHPAPGDRSFALQQYQSMERWWCFTSLAWIWLWRRRGRLQGPVAVQGAQGHAACRWRERV